MVTRGFWGRFFIAIEPLTIAMCFTGLATGLLMLHREGAIFIAPIFAGAAILFMIYAVVLMVPVTRALIEAYGSIWVVDGYVRYREHAARDRDTCYYIAVLDDRRNVIGEWPLESRPDALDRAEPWPALVEFTRYGGVLRIDGRSTGVLPDEMPALGIGAPAAWGERNRPPEPLPSAERDELA